ncbi:hypothetical protein KIN20_015603 [Parelaphostrongylus tenuis]|uniref:Uncharacterized protein n=1 Tax=Parelaphostrongylus tenuis TaxID=148309 RepID=A0AAD5MF68_PARTN|nr:hypothetical protein KIN20_015603 [Parelaphostrongylus tenuis]
MRRISMRKSEVIMESLTGFVIRVHIPQIPIEDIDYGWEVRMLYIFTKYLELERLMWKMSTLGVACSAMADYDISFRCS